MKRADRLKASQLESIMGRLDYYERRALHDLREIGFRFTTVDQAKRRLQAQRTLAGFTQAQIDIAVKAAENREIGRSS